MRRGKGLRTNREKQRAWQDRSRGSISAEREQAAAERAVREAVFARDRQCVLHDMQGATAGFLSVPPCSGPRSPHHRRKAGAAGAYNEANLVQLCLGHNQWVEDEPNAARVLAPRLVVREGDPEWEQLGKRAARYG